MRQLFIALVVGLVFLTTVDHPFHFDDEHSITQNPHIRPPVDWGRILTDPAVFSRNPGSGMYRPVVMMSYVANVAIGSFDPRTWHIVNILVHIVCCVLVARLAALLGGDRLAQSVAALLFGLHPLVAEPINYVSSRSESMALMFCLATIVTYLIARGRARGYVAASGLFLLGLGCKVTAIFALPVLLLYELAHADLSKNWRRWAPLASIAVVYVIFVRQLWQEAMFAAPVREPLVQLLTQAKALSYYVKLIIVPAGLTIEHAFETATSLLDPVVIASIGLVATLLWLALSRLSRGRLYLGLWPLLSLVPTIVVPLNVLVSEHRLYPGLAGLALLAGLSTRFLRRPVPRVAVLAIVLLAVLSMGRNRVWATEQFLWSEAASRGQSVRAHVRLGVAHRQVGELGLAERHLRTALTLAPDHAPALNNLGNVMRQRGRPAEARSLYEAALHQLPAYPEALINLGSLHTQDGHLVEALMLYTRATQIAPDHFEGWNNLATLLLKQGDGAAAEAALRQGLQRKPDSAPMLFNLSGALELQDRPLEAMAALQRAVEIDAGYARAWLHLGNLLRAADQPAPARQAYEHFLETYRGDPAILEQVRTQVQALQVAGTQ